MQLLDFMKENFDAFAEQRVKILAVPLPPTPVNGLLYVPQAFSTIEAPEKGEAVKNSVVFYDRTVGPVIFFTTALKNLIDYNRDTGELQVQLATFCAGVSFKRLSLNGVDYADEVVLDSLTMISSSCHPGSHYIVPGAPYLTALLQYQQCKDSADIFSAFSTRSDSLIHFEYLSPEEGKIIAPGVDWSCNEVVDYFVSLCGANISHARIYGGMGRWCVEYCRELNTTLIIGENRSEGNGIIEEEKSYDRERCAAEAR